MNLKVLATGSSGNCCILTAGEASLLLDAGIRYPGIQKGLDYDMASVAGCLVTHEHNDHSKAVKQLAKAGVDIYMSAGTAAAIGITGHRIHAVNCDSQYDIGDWIVRPFPTQHDAAEPLGFMILHRPTGEKLLYVTDTYYSRYRADGAHYIICECNYIKDTLDTNIEAGRIPEVLKNRLLRSHFELSNVIDWLKASDLRQCRKIVLVHLSDGNSDEKRMVREIQAATAIDTIAARAGLEIDLRLCPF